MAGTCYVAKEFHVVDDDFIRFYNDSSRQATELVVALDLEWYDQTNGDHITEIGIAVQADGGKVVNRHIRIEEHAHLVNRYCPTSYLGFVYGETVVASRWDAMGEIVFWLDGGGNDCPVDLVWHNAQHDENILLRNRVPVYDYVRQVFDTGMIYRRQASRPNNISLKNMCVALNIPHQPGEFHNSGNDAALTLMAFNRLRERGRLTV